MSALNSIELPYPAHLNSDPSPSSGVANVFINIVNIWSHGGDHGGQTSSLGKVRDDLSSLNTCIIILVDQ